MTIINSNKLIVYVDGFSSPKKKNRAGTCVCIMSPDKQTYSLGINYKNPDATNNQMELAAISDACQTLIDGPYNGYTVTIYSDSEVAVRLINGRYKTKQPALKEYLKDVLISINLAKSLAGIDVRVEWIGRNNNEAGKVLERLRKIRRN